MKGIDLIGNHEEERPVFRKPILRGFFTLHVILLAPRVPSDFRFVASCSGMLALKSELESVNLIAFYGFGLKTNFK